MPRFSEGDAIQLVETQGVPSHLIGATGVVVGIERREAGGTHQGPGRPTLPPMEQWEQLYMIRLDEDGETMLAREPWLRQEE